MELQSWRMSAYKWPLRQCESLVMERGDDFTPQVLNPVTHRYHVTQTEETLGRGGEVVSRQSWVQVLDLSSGLLWVTRRQQTKPFSWHWALNPEDQVTGTLSHTWSDFSWLVRSLFSAVEQRGSFFSAVTAAHCLVMQAHRGKYWGLRPEWI